MKKCVIYGRENIEEPFILKAIPKPSADEHYHPFRDADMILDFLTDLPTETLEKLIVKMKQSRYI